MKRCGSTTDNDLVVQNKRTKLTETIKKFTSFTITNAQLTETANGKPLEFQKNNVIDGLQFWIKCYPNGCREDDVGHVSLYLWVSSPVKVKYTAILVGSTVAENASCLFSENKNWGWATFATHQKVRDTFKNGKAEFIISAEFEVNLIPFRLFHNIFKTREDIPFDCELVVGNETVEAHKHILAILSPKLYAKFYTVEATTKKVIITDFDFETVKLSVDFLYGRNLDKLSIEDIVKTLRFFNKYNIESSNLEKVLFYNITVKAFSMIVHYAYDCSKNLLFDKCVKFFSEIMNTIKNQDDFKKLPVMVIIRILVENFILTSIYDLLQKGHKHNFQMVIDYLEPILVITEENFCDTLIYAENCKRSDLWTKCVDFLSNTERRANITISEKFLNMGDIALRVLKDVAVKFK